MIILHSHNLTLPEVKAFRLAVNSFLSGYSSGLLFHRRAQSISQKTELSLLKAFASAFFLLLRLWSHSSLRWGSLTSNRNWTSRTGSRRSSWSAFLRLVECPTTCQWDPVRGKFRQATMALKRRHQSYELATNDRLLQRNRESDTNGKIERQRISELRTQWLF